MKNIPSLAFVYVCAPFFAYSQSLVPQVSIKGTSSGESSLEVSADAQFLHGENNAVSINMAGKISINDGLGSLINTSTQKSSKPNVEKSTLTPNSELSLSATLIEFDSLKTNKYQHAKETKLKLIDNSYKKCVSTCISKPDSTFCTEHQKRVDKKYATTIGSKLSKTFSSKKDDIIDHLKTLQEVYESSAIKKELNSLTEIVSKLNWRDPPPNQPTEGMRPVFTGKASEFAKTARNLRKWYKSTEVQTTSDDKLRQILLETQEPDIDTTTIKQSEICQSEKSLTDKKIQEIENKNVSFAPRFQISPGISTKQHSFEYVVLTEAESSQSIEKVEDRPIDLKYGISGHYLLSDGDIQFPIEFTATIGSERSANPEKAELCTDILTQTSTTLKKCETVSIGKFKREKSRTHGAALGLVQHSKGYRVSFFAKREIVRNIHKTWSFGPALYVEISKSGSEAETYSGILKISPTIQVVSLDDPDQKEYYNLFLNIELLGQRRLFSTKFDSFH